MHHTEQTAHTRLGPLRCRVIGSGPTFILAVHPIIVDGRFWDDVAHALADEATVIVPDFPFGAHDSPVPNRARLNPSDMSLALLEILDELSIPQAMLLGNDLGTGICQMAAVAHPERFPLLALTSGDALKHFPPSAKFKVLFKNSHLPGVAKALVAAFRLKPMFAKPGQLNTLVRHPVEPALIKSWTSNALKNKEVRKDLIACLRSMSPEYTMSVAEKLRFYEGTTVIAWSREDKLFPPSDAEQLASIIPNAHITWIDDAYAFSPLDQPLAIAAAIREILPTTD